MQINKFINTKTLNGKDQPGQINPMAGQRFLGTFSTGNKLNIDSISGNALNDNEKMLFSRAINNMFNQMNFPDHPLKIGETFEQEIPMSLPLAGESIETIIKIVYTLLEVKDNLATFDMAETMDFNLTKQKNNVTISVVGIGKGGGKLIYDIDKSYYLTRETDLSINYTSTAGKLIITGKGEITSRSLATVSSKN